MLSTSDLNAVSGLVRDQIQTIFTQVRTTVKPKSVSLTADPKDLKRQELDMDARVFNIMIDCIHELVSSCRTQRNGLAPVNNFPQDVVSLIFASILSPLLQSRLEYYSTLNSLRLVCKAWMNVIDGSPHYWKYAPSHLSSTFLDKVLERARGIPMVVKYYTLSRKQLQQQDPGLLPRLSDRGWPVRSFACFGRHFNGSEINLLKEFLGTQAPNIEDLEVEALVQGGGRHFIITNLFAGHAPQLRGLNLRNVGIHWDTLMLPNLRKLALGHYEGSENHWLTVPSLLRVLRTCPSLESLTLNNTPFLHPDSVTPTLEKLLMECLNEIILQSLPPLIADDILRSLSPNVCSTLIVTVYERSPAPTQVSRLIDGVMEMMPARNVSVHTQNTHQMEVQGGRWKVIIAGPPERQLTQTQYRRRLIESLPVAVRSVVKIHNMAQLSYPGALPILLSVVHEAFPQLHELFLADTSTFYLDILSTPSEQGWLIPNLRTLGLSGTRLGSAEVMHVVQLARARCTQQVISNREIAPAPLEIFKTPLNKPSILQDEAKTAFEELEKVFETVQYDLTPLRSEPADANVVFMSNGYRRRTLDWDSDSLSDF